MNKALIAGLLLLVLLSGCIEGNPTYIISEDVNGEDINVGTVFADVIDANAVKANYFVARNYIDANYLGNGFFNKDINVAGTGTFGEIIDNGLTANLGVYTDGSKQLTSTPPTSGVLGYWSRAGTVISTATAGDDITTSGKIYGGTSYSFILGDFDNAIAGFFDNGSGFTATLGTGSGHTFTDGSRTAVLSNGSAAGFFDDGGGRQVTLSGAATAITATDGTHTINIADGSYGVDATGNSYIGRLVDSSNSRAGYFEYSGSYFAELASSNYPFYAYDNSSNYVYMMGNSSYTLEAYNSGKSAAIYGSDGSSNYGQIADGSNAIYGYHGSSNNYGSIGTSSYGIEAYLSSGSAAVYASDGFSNVAQLATGSYPLYVNDTGGNYFYGGGGSSSYVGEFYSADRSAAIYAYDSPTGNYVYLAEGTTNQYSAIYAYKGGSGNYSGVFTDGSMTAVFTNGGEAGNFYGGGSYSAYLARSSLAGLFDDGSNSVTLVDSTYSLYANRSSTSYAGYFAYGSMYAALSGSYPGEFNDGSSNYCYVGGGSSSYSLECYSANKSAAVYGSDSSSNYGTIADGSTGLYGYYNNGNYGSVGSNSYGVEAYLSSGSAAVYAYDSSSNYVNLVDGSYSLYANSNSLTAAAYLTNGNNYGEIGHGNYASYFYNSGTGDHVYLAENSSYNAAIYAVRSGGVYAGWFVDGTRQAYFASSNEAGYFSGSGGNSVSLGDGTYALNISGNSITTGNVIIDSDSSQLQLGDDQDMFLFSDAVNTLNFEGSTADTDLEFYFTGSSYSGTMWWQEDENKFHFDQTISTDGDGNIGGNANVGGTLYVDGNYGAFGEMWQKNSAIVLGLPAQDVYYQVDDWNVGDFYNTELNPDQNCIDAKQSGMYLMSLSISYTGSANTTFHFKIFKNGVGLEHCHVENKSGAGAEGAVPITCLERLIADTDQVGVRVEQETGANKVIQISSANLNIARVG